MKTTFNFILINGSQIIGQVEKLELETGFVLVEKPRLISIDINPNNPQESMIKLIPVAISPGTKDEIHLNMNTVTAISDVSIELHKHYQQVTSGIDLTTRLK